MFNLAASLWKVQSPLRLAARIWNYDVKTHDMLIKCINLMQRHRVGPTSEHARCLKLLNQSTWARQWSKAWISSCVTTRFIWDCWWMLFWHKTICKPTQITLWRNFIKPSGHASIFLDHKLSYLRRSWVKATTDRPLTIFTWEMSVFEHFTALRGENKVVQDQSIYGDSYSK